MSPNHLFAVGGALSGLTWALGQPERSWRSVVVWTVLGAIAGLTLASLLFQPWDSIDPNAGQHM